MHVGYDVCTWDAIINMMHIERLETVNFRVEHRSTNTHNLIHTVTHCLVPLRPVSMQYSGSDLQELYQV